MSSCLYWRKQAVLRIFANWCKENANDVGLAPWECLSDDMTLFDVVYLDIVHGFDVPYNVLMKYGNTGWSGKLVSRLGIVVAVTDSLRKKQRNENKHSFLFKTVLMMQHAIDSKFTSVETILYHVSLLIQQKEFAIAARVLESGADELWNSSVSIPFDDIFASIMSFETNNDIRELTNMTAQD